MPRIQNPHWSLRLSPEPLPAGLERRGERDPAAFKGREIRLKFELRAAKLTSFEFSD